MFTLVFCFPRIFSTHYKSAVCFWWNSNGKIKLYFFQLNIKCTRYSNEKTQTRTSTGKRKFNFIYTVRCLFILTKQNSYWLLKQNKKVLKFTLKWAYSRIISFLMKHTRTSVHILWVPMLYLFQQLRNQILAKYVKYANV